MTDKIRTSVDLGNGEEGRQRLSDLHKLAEKFGAIGQRGPSISNLLQMIADGEIDLMFSKHASLTPNRRANEYTDIDTLADAVAQHSKRGHWHGKPHATTSLSDWLAEGNLDENPTIAELAVEWDEE